MVYKYLYRRKVLGVKVFVSLQEVAEKQKKKPIVVLGN